jgi:hypothetical protein
MLVYMRTISEQGNSQTLTDRMERKPAELGWVVREDKDPGGDDESLFQKLSRS